MKKGSLQCFHKNPSSRTHLKPFPPKPSFKKPPLHKIPTVKKPFPPKPFFKKPFPPPVPIFKKPLPPSIPIFKISPFKKPGHPPVPVVERKPVQIYQDPGYHNPVYAFDHIINAAAMLRKIQFHQNKVR
ncbi:hypothetical protein ACE6H2_006239 [Prunus campanulata]